MISAEGSRITVETKTVTAIFDNGRLVSLCSSLTQEEFMAMGQGQTSSIQLVYQSGEVVDVDAGMLGNVDVRFSGGSLAEFRFHGWAGDGIIAISEDEESGEVIVEPSAYSRRSGLIACRWVLPGIRHDLELVAPFYQGVRLKLDDELVRHSRWIWPSLWEAGLVLLQGPTSGFWVHCEDDRGRYKALNVGTAIDPFGLGFDSEAYGPRHANRAAGGLAWRINVYQGDWRVPATRYKQWFWQTYRLRDALQKRSSWIQDIRLVLYWCPLDPGILDAVSRVLPPSSVLVHIHDWRTDPYDENYPTYHPSERAKAFVDHGNALGFRILPHFNSVDMDPTHSLYPVFQDFGYRDLSTGGHIGWAWDQARGAQLPVPESAWGHVHNRTRKVMVKIHPGLSMWRSTLAEAIEGAVEEIRVNQIFLDVTLTTYNLDNCFVEGMTSTEGMNRLIERLSAVGGGLAIAGEGLNEMSVQKLSFASAHLFKSAQQSIGGLERTGGCPLNDFLFAPLCRTFGYAGLAGRNEDEELRMRIHDEHHAIPTLTIGSAEAIVHPNAVVRRLLERAVIGG